MASLKNIVFLFFIFSSFCAEAERRKIKYSLPPKADSIASVYISMLGNRYLNENSVYAILREKNDTFIMIISGWEKKRLYIKSIETEIIKRSNRILFIGKNNKIPVLLDNFDNYLIEPGYFLKPNGMTMHDVNIGHYHSFYMKFTLFNEIIQYDYGSYQLIENE